MASDSPRFSVLPGGAPAPDGPAAREYQELWFSIARKPWMSVVLVPGEEGLSAGPIATALASVGTRLRDKPVTAIVSHALDYSSARALADLQPRIDGDEHGVASVDLDGSSGQAAAISPTPARDVLAVTDASRAALARKGPPARPRGRVIVAIQPVVSEPLGVAVARSADAVIVCIPVGTARVEAIRRTVELIGPERIMGALVLR